MSSDSALAKGYGRQNGEPDECRLHHHERLCRCSIQPPKAHLLPEFVMIGQGADVKIAMLWTIIPGM